MPALSVYQQVYDLLDTHLDEKVYAASRERITLLVVGIIGAKSAPPSRIAEALSQLRLSDVTPESIERRIRRIENDDELTAVLCIHPFIRERLVIGKLEHLLLIIDPTTQEDRVVMVTVSVWYRGRSLPLVWTTWPANQPLEGDSFWERIESLIQTIQPLLPKGVEITWLADRAFGTPMFCDMITARGWHFVVRVQGQTRYIDCSGKSQRIDNLVTRQGQCTKLRGCAIKKHQWRDVSVVVYWGTRHQTPLCLVTSHPPKWRIILLYRRRFPIEAMFRDYKSYGWQFEQGQVTDLEHLELLLVGMALATWVTIYVGTQVAADHLSQPPTTGRRRTIPWIGKRSLFRLGLSLLHQLFNDPTEHPLRWQFLDWSAGNWQQQVYFHHAKAYVFATSEFLYLSALKPSKERGRGKGLE